jgi:hypothetical protein
VPAQTVMYLYNQKQWVVLLESAAASTRRYEKVYAKELTINRGVDNLIQFAFINQEQKPINITGKQITCRIINAAGNKILLQKTLVPVLPITGITSLQLTVADIENIEPQQCFYSLEIPVGNFDYPVFVDADGGARGVIRIVNSVLPSFVPAKDITIPTHPRPRGGLSRTYYSSIINTNESPILTTQRWLEDFTGTLQFQGSTVMDFSTFYSLSPEYNYNDYTGTEGYTINGYHPYVRLKIINNGTPPAASNGDLNGDIVKLLAR